MEVKGILHINIESSDLEKTVNFYTSNFGFKQTFETKLGDMDVVFLDAGNCIIEIFHRLGVEKRSRTAAVIDHFAIEITDIEAFIAKLRTNNVTILQDATAMIVDAPIKMAFIEGPDGERIELFEYLHQPVNTL